MNVFGIQFGESDKYKTFKGIRTSRNTVAQLAKNNHYSLTDINQRNIANAIKELANIPGENNIKFLLNTAAKNVYQTNIELKDKPKNNWKQLLLAAVASAIAVTPFINESAFAKKIEKIKNAKTLNDTEKEILKQRENLLKAVNLEQIKTESVNNNEKDFVKNLDYFIVSSETSLDDKKYVLERLNYLMSEEYEINEQLKDKKSLVAAEMINDMAIAVPGNKIPNIKAVNQKHHGICADISIVRKKLAYEDKRNYVDSILSELDNTDKMSVYDRSKLGSGEKINVPKSYVDYSAALKKGYRIIDASSMVWMQTSYYSGYSNLIYNVYNAFDQENFDVNNDSFFNANFADEELAKIQKYYQSLLKLKDALESYKTTKIVKNIKSRDIYQNYNNNLQYMALNMQKIKNILSNIFPSFEQEDINILSSKLINLRHDYSKDLSKNNKYEYIINEEDAVKKQKIKNFLKDNYHADVEDSVINTLFENIEYFQDLEAANDKSALKMSKLGKAQYLYEIAANFRAAFLNGLEIDTYKEILAKNEKLPNKERLLQETIGLLISKIKNNSEDSERIVEQLSCSLCEEMNTSKDRKGVLEALNKLRITVDHIVQDMFDLAYNNLLLVDRKHALIAYIDNLIVQISENKDTALKNKVAAQLNINNYEKTVVKVLNSLKNKLYNGDEKEYSEVFDKIHSDSQFNVIRENLIDLKERLETEEKESIINSYKQALESHEGFDAEQLNKIIDSHLQVLDSSEDSINKFINSLKITDDNGHILYSADKKDVLLKKYENINEIISKKDLQMIQDHLDKIMKVKSADEFNSVQGKIKDKSLYKFSQREQFILNTVDKNVNSMYSYLQKYLEDVRSVIKNPLEELCRVAGVDSGRWWVGEGSSGLFSGQQVKILEFITGRPHYSTNELKKAIDTIKQSPYSGISTSSVFDDKVGMHAQYIADIKPMTVKSGDKEEIKEVLFHDNTWGPREHENVWVDSAGLLRTDYGDRRGGKLGYVTDDMYRNGNLVERILSDMTVEEKSEQVNNKVYKKIKNRDNSDYKNSQYTDIIIEGTSPKLKEYADDIRENVFQSSVRLISSMKKLVSDYTADEIRGMIKKAGYDGGNWRSSYNNLLRRIYDNFKRAEDIKVKYDSLSDTDELKLALEKVALKSNYNSTLMIHDIAKAGNVKDLSKFVRRQRIKAINNFKYSFNKDINFIQYLLNNFGEKDVAAIDKILSKYNIQLDDDTYDNIFVSFELDDKDWNGSLKDTIDTLIKSMSEKMDEHIQNSSAKADLLNYMRNSMREMLYFNESDLKNPKLDNIIKFIDRVYNPVDDEEFISVYRKIQNMTSEQFKKDVLSQVKNQDLGIKSNTGFDVLKKLLKYDDEVEQSLMNEIYYENISNVIDESSYKPLYNYNKLTRKTSYTYKDTFDSAYRKLKNDLSLLDLPKLFNKYKNRNLRSYGVYPAYPKIDYIDPDSFQKMFDYAIGSIPDVVSSSSFAKRTEHYYEAVEVLKNYAKTKKDSEILDDKEYEALNVLLGDIATSIYGNELQQNALEEVLAAMDLEQGVEFSEFRKHINKVVKYANNYEKSFSKQDIKNLIMKNKELMKTRSLIFTETFIQKKHRAAMINLIDKYIQSLAKSNPLKDIQPEDYLNQILDKYEKWHILNNTEELLDTYVESLAKDTDCSADRRANIETLLINAVSYARLADIETIIMDAIEAGNETSIKNEFNEIYLDTVDGSKVPMSTDSIINQMVDSFVLGNNKDTAKMFIEKLGLNEKYVKFIAENFTVDELKEMVDASEEDDKKYKKFTDEFDKLAEDTYSGTLLQKNPDRAVNKLKRDVIAALKENNIPLKTAKPLINAFDDAKLTIKSKSTLDPADVLRSIINEGMVAVLKLSDKDNEVLNERLNKTQLYMELINDLPLNINSDANKLRDETVQKWSDFLAYCDTKDNLHVMG